MNILYNSDVIKCQLYCNIKATCVFMHVYIVVKWDMNTHNVLSIKVGQQDIQVRFTSTCTSTKLLDLPDVHQLHARCAAEFRDYKLFHEKTEPAQSLVFSNNIYTCIHRVKPKMIHTPCKF